MIFDIHKDEREMKVLNIMLSGFFFDGLNRIKPIIVKLDYIKEKVMKALKMLVLAVILGAIFSSCASYSCPTYSKETPKQEHRLRSV